MTGSKYITSFLQAHRAVIEYASMTADQLVVTLKATVTADQAILFFTDLITYCEPLKATIVERRKIVVRF